MERPVARFIGGDIQFNALGGFDDNGVFARIAQTIAVHQFHEHAVQMNWVRHHRVIHQHQSEALAVVKSGLENAALDSLLVADLKKDPFRRLVSAR